MRNLFLPPIVWLSSVIAALALHAYFPIFHSEAETWRSTIGILAIAIALSVTVWHKRLFIREETNINTFDTPDKLIESGLFRYVRNPMYLGFAVSLAALAFVLGAASPWLVVFGFFALSHCWYISIEERAMRDRFGADYEEYRSRTRRWV